METRVGEGDGRTHGAVRCGPGARVPGGHTSGDLRMYQHMIGMSCRLLTSVTIACEGGVGVRGGVGAGNQDWGGLGGSTSWF